MNKRVSTVVGWLVISLGISVVGGCPMMEVGNDAGGGSGLGLPDNGTGDAPDGANGNSNNDGDGTDNTIGAKLFDVTDLRVKSYDVEQANPRFLGSSTVLFGTFPTDPLAIRYTVRYVNPDAPALEYEVSWAPGEPVPDPAAVLGADNVVPGYVDGIVGGEYFIRVSSAGCQGGDACALDGETTLRHEERLRDVGGMLSVRIDYR